MTRKHKSRDGAVFTEQDLERWADEAEAGFPGATFDKSTPGRPVTVGAEARPFTLRLDQARRAKLDQTS